MPSIQFLRRWCLVLACIPSVVLADPPMVAEALLKLGSCPSGYATSGGYCVPGRHARVALAKRGPCPSGYATSGVYCLAGARARPAIAKVGLCPSGWSTSAGYYLRR